jgi:hypothetical protein
VQTHITTPYEPFTRSAVFNLLSDRKPIPSHDPTSLTLPTDPLVSYLSILASTVEPYTEKLQTTNEARLLIKRLLASKPPRVAMFVDEENEQEKYRHHRPATPPILTRRAIRDTPIIGKPRAKLRSYAAYTQNAPPNALQPVPVQEVPEPQVNFDQILFVPPRSSFTLWLTCAYRDVKHYIRAEDHPAVRSLLKLAAKPRAPKHTHAYLPSSLVEQSHPIQDRTPPPESPPFLPIFPRRVPVCPPTRAKKRTRESHGQSAEIMDARDSGLVSHHIPESMMDLSTLVKTAVGEDSGKADLDVCEWDLCEENMIVVNGWRMPCTLSSPIYPLI